MNNTYILNPPFSITKSSFFRRSFSLKILWTTMFILITSLLIFCVFQVGSLTQETYLIKDYEKRLASLSKESGILEINFSRTNSLSNIENYLQKENFVKANQVKYIQTLESSVVTK